MGGMGRFSLGSESLKPKCTLGGAVTGFREGGEMGSEVGLTEVGAGEMVTSFRGWDEGLEGGGWQPDKRLAWQEEVRRGAPSLPVLHMSLESLSHMQELYYSYEDCLRNAYSM